MDPSSRRLSEDTGRPAAAGGAGFQTQGLAPGHATNQKKLAETLGVGAATTTTQQNRLRSTSPAPSPGSTAKKAEGPAKTQKAKDATSKLVALSKRGLGMSSGGDGKASGSSELQQLQQLQQQLQPKIDKKAAANKKTAATKPIPEKPKDITDLHVVFPLDLSVVPRVDIIAVHDVDETLQKAWLYRKRAKRRPNDFRTAYASGGINSHDGEAGLGTTGSPAPGHRRPLRQPLVPSTKKKNVEDSIERWLAVSAARSGDEEAPRETTTPEPPEPVDPLFLPPSSSPAADGYGDSGVLATVHEDDDGHFQISDDLFSHGVAPGIRRRPTFPKEKKRKGGGRIPAIAEEHKVPSVGDVGEPRRHNADILSDHQSSDQGQDRRVNWLSDLDMLPSEIQGARVMCYTYRGIDKTPSAWQYLTERADDLVKRLIQKRSSESLDYTKVPIVLIGLGFGALIVQRAINLMATSRTEETPSTNLNMIASLIFLDAPAPNTDREQFPRSRSQEVKKAWTQDWLGKQRVASGALSTKIDTYSLWNSLRPFTSVLYNIPILWHYAPMMPLPGKPAVTPKSLDVAFVPKQSLTAHRLSRFEGPNDADYRSIMDAVKRSLIVRCAITKSDKLAACLPDFLRDTFVVDMRDQHGQTPLHHAVKAGNPDAVKRLIHQGKASVTKKDRDGRSPLNIAVQEAVHKVKVAEDDPEHPRLQKSYTQIINLLIKNGARVDDRDNGGRTPWAYAEGDGNQWIRRLKDKHLIIGSSSTASGGMELVLPPKPGPQREACHAFDIILAEVFLQRKRERFSEIFNIDLASVYDIIYKGTSTISQVLEASRPDQMTQDKVRCRWIHLPSNNEQWVHDLLVSLGIQDGSMGGQRHEGSRLIDRYMMPQARRYKHFHGFGKKPSPDPRPKASRVDSSATVVLDSEDFPPTAEEVRIKQAKASKIPSIQELTRTESDAVVIFMPILGFEKHRHRKYLTQAFREADKAMRLAQERDDSPDPKSATLKNSAPQRGGRKKQESSDDGESSSEKESSRMYPTVRITRAREQVKAMREAQLLRGYLDSRQVKPVHCRRTLDQFSYYMLNSTEARDKSQVAYRWAKSPGVCAEAKNRPIVMVDQLWMWALHDGTIVTCSPNTWNGQEEYNLSNVIVRELRYNKDRPIIKSIEDLLHLILKTSLDFFKRKGPAGFQFHECFQSSINNVSEQQGHLFDNFRRTTKRLHVGKLDPVERKKEIEFLFSLDEETELLVEIMDIQDELTIVKTILGQQKIVLENLLRLYPKKLDDEDGGAGGGTTTLPGLGKSELLVLQGLVQLLKDQASPADSKAASKPPLKDGSTKDGYGPALMGNPSIVISDERPPGAGGHEAQVQKKRKEKDGDKPSTGSTKPTAAPGKVNILQNRDLMYETMGIIENNIRVVADMLAYAEKVESSLENLLDLKQKHANGWEARFAREGSEETQRQGNIILVFTLVTVVFLPLSFLTSFLALGVDVFPRNAESGELDWPLGQVSGYLFGISAGLSFPLILLALYVNKLITRIKRGYKQMLKALREPDAILDPQTIHDTDGHDSDEERTHMDPRTVVGVKSDRYGPYGSHKTMKSIDDGPDDSDDDENPTYAPLFGKYHFHSKIPFIRTPWRYRKYRQPHAKRRDNRWKDTYITDYPLHYYHSKVNMWFLTSFVAVLAYFGSAKHQRARSRHKKRQRARGNAGSGTSSDSSASSESDSDDPKLNEKGRAPAKGRSRGGLKKRKSVSSGYWVNGAGNRSTGRDVDGDGTMDWSNQTRSRGSLRFSEGEGGGRGRGKEEGKKRRLGWLRLRRKGKTKGAVDEETGEGVLEGRRGSGGDVSST